MEIVASVVTGTLLLLVGGRIGFALGREYEKQRAIKFTGEIIRAITKRLGLPESELVKHLEAVKKELS